MKIIIVITCALLILIANYACAANTYYEIINNELYGYKYENDKQLETKICTNKVIADGISYETVDLDFMVITNDEKYFIYSGAEAKDAKRQFIIFDLKQCKILKRVIGINAYDFSVAYSSVTGSVYITWILLDENNPLTIEYSGDQLAKERRLTNIRIPKRLRYNNELRDKYKFSNNNRLMLTVGSSKNDFLSIYDIVDDKLLFRAINRKEFLGDKKINLAEFLPDIANDLVMYTTVTPIGIDLYLFNFKQKKQYGLIHIPEKNGLGQFSSKGDKVIFSTLPNKNKFKKEIIVYDVSSGTELGKAVLDEDYKIIDVTDDARNLLYEVKGQRKKIYLTK